MKFPVQSLYTWYRQLIRHPQYRWLVVLGTLAYLVFPFDIAPDFIPFIGQIDDLVIVTLLASELSQLFIDRFKGRTVSSDTAANPASTDFVDVNAVPFD